MTNISRSVIAALVLGIMVAGVTGCQKEGPMEKAGKKLDNGSQTTGERVDKAIEKTGDKIEQAGDKIKDSVK